MKKSVAMNWINALRSGKYKQGQFKLHDKDANTFCCLGVLDDLYPELNLSDDSESVLINFNKIGLNGTTGVLGGFTSLTSLNDHGYTFDEIADIIQIEYVEGL
jgi:hypothetical protein